MYNVESCFNAYIRSEILPEIDPKTNLYIDKTDYNKIKEYPCIYISYPRLKETETARLEKKVACFEIMTISDPKNLELITEQLYSLLGLDTGADGEIDLYNYAEYDPDSEDELEDLGQVASWTLESMKKNDPDNKRRELCKNKFEIVLSYAI